MKVVATSNLPLIDGIEVQVNGLMQLFVPKNSRFRFF
jgi:hypothetical protein